MIYTPPKPTLANSAFLSRWGILCLCVLWLGTLYQCTKVPAELPDVTACQRDTDCATNHYCQSGACVTLAEPGQDGGSKEGAGCTDGEERECFSGTDDQRNKGVCKGGLQTCQAGEWGSCKGETLPAKDEDCADQLDNNCDGNVNEGCPCTVGDTRPCGSSEGLCELGVQTCEGKDTWSTCKNEVKPTAEVCDGKDNNCDGQIDETFLALNQPCSLGQGLCEVSGKFICDPSTLKTKCDALPNPTKPEICNDKDDDCDGRIDNVFETDPPTTCTVDGKLGSCMRGEMKCLGGKMQCAQTKFQEKDVCNGFDDDCDGNIDNIVGTQSPVFRSCYTGTPPTTKGAGICKSGVQKCEKGTWGSCEGEVTPATETCNNKDDDCDGQIDNLSSGGVCTCIATTKRSCGSSTGLCVAGTQVCDTSGKWGSCEGETKPVQEICDNQDNDCDGLTDNGIAPTDCLVNGAKGVCQSGKKICDGACVQIVQPTKEVCDGKDNNCDGDVDVCKPGDKRCQGVGPGSYIEQCNADCTGWQRIQTCGAYSRCSDNKCVQCSCRANTTYCSPDGTSQYTCKADCSGRESSVKKCGSNQRCYSNQCRDCKCPSGAKQCVKSDNKQIQSCSCTQGWKNYSRCSRYKRCYQRNGSAWCWY